MSAFGELCAAVAEHAGVDELVVHKVLEMAAQAAAGSDIFEHLSRLDRVASAWVRIADALEELARRPGPQQFSPAAGAAQVTTSHYPTVTVVEIDS